jgi:hypothetical protein
MPPAVEAVTMLDHLGVVSRAEARTVLALWARLSTSAQARVLFSLWAARPPLSAEQVDQILQCFADEDHDWPPTAGETVDDPTGLGYSRPATDPSTEPARHERLPVGYHEATAAI